MSKKYFILLIYLFCCNISNAQINFSGKILQASDKTPISGAYVRINDAKTVSDAAGDFTILVPKAAVYVLEVSSVGFKTLKKNVLENELIEIILSEENIMLQTAAVTAGKFERPLSEITVSLDVLKPQLLENTNTRRLDDVLQKVPGVVMIDGQANIRGGAGWSYGAGSRVLLLVDDIPALQADAGFPNWRDLPVENIEQIEVVKGAASALYGSAAMNGIINVRTGFAKSTPETRISTQMTRHLAPADAAKCWWCDSSFNKKPYDFSTSITHKQKFGKLDVAATLFYFRLNSFNKNQTDSFGRASFNLRYRIKDNMSVGLNFNMNKGASNGFFYWKNSTNGAYIGDATTYTSSRKLRYTIDPYFTFFQKNGNRHKVLGRYFSVENNVSGGRRNSSQLLYGEYQFQRTFAENWVVTAGLVGSRTNIQSQLYGNNNFKAYNTAAYAQMDKKFGTRWNISAGLRYERNTIFAPDSVKFQTVFGTKSLPVPNNGTLIESKPVMRIGVNYQAAKASYLRASFGQGYRFPTIAEMFVNTQAGALQIVPNPELTSETGWTTEIGLKQGFKLGGLYGYADVAAFWQEYENMMEFLVSKKVLGFESRNVGNTRIRGVETSIFASGKIGKLTPSVILGYTYISPQYNPFSSENKFSSSDSTVNVLKYRFRHSFKADAEVAYGKLSAGFALIYNSKMENVDAILERIAEIGKFRQAHDAGFTVIDFRAAYRFTNKIKLSLLANNVFNEEYTYRPGLLEAPRSVSVRLDFKF